MGFLRQTYKGEYDWWRWLLILGIFVPHTFRNYLKEILKPLSKLLPEGKGSGLILELSLYLILLPLLVLFFRVLHRRFFFTLITSREKFDWVRFLLSFATWGMFIVVSLLIIMFLNKGDVNWNIEFFSFVKLLVICLLLVPVRALFEDVLFRGYFLQSLICFFKIPWIAIIINVLITAVLMHVVNSYLLNFVGFHILMYYFMVNLFSAIIVVLDDGLEIILGMKIINNLSILLFTTLEIYSSSGKSVVENKTGDAVILITLLSIYLGFPLYFLFLRKTYGWHNWKDKLFTKVEND